MLSGLRFLDIRVGRGRGSSRGVGVPVLRRFSIVDLDGIAVDIGRFRRLPEIDNYNTGCFLDLANF